MTLSHEILREYREYERAMTTLIDVMVKPYCKTYLAHAQARIAERSGEVPFLIMQSNGGVAPIDECSRMGVRAILSGPAGGVSAAAYHGELLDEPKFTWRGMSSQYRPIGKRYSLLDL